MAKNWVTVITPRVTDWGIPMTRVTELTDRAADAEAALTAATNDATRTPVATARCRAAFDAMALCMRDIKRRYFLKPPLTDADEVSLGLKPHDSHPTQSGVPTAQVAVETFLTGIHEMGVRFVYITGNPDDAANKGYRIYYSAIAPGEPEPEHPRYLRNSFFTRRLKDVIKCDYADSGKRLFIAVQIENDGKKGEWGPMISAVIP
jgi:hypothetical protein